MTIIFYGDTISQTILKQISINYKLSYVKNYMLFDVESTIQI